MGGPIEIYSVRNLLMNGEFEIKIHDKSKGVVYNLSVVPYNLIIIFVLFSCLFFLVIGNPPTQFLLCEHASWPPFSSAL